VKRLAVFDVDGTLVDSRRSIGDAMRDAFTALDLEAQTYDQTRRIVGLNLAEAIQVLAPDLPVERYPDLGMAYKEAFIRNREAGHLEPLYDGARAALEALHKDGWTLGIATGKARRGLDYILDHHGLRDVFACGFCADDGPGKPDPHMLRLNMDKQGADPARTVMIGDTSFDMAMARAAGVYALGVTWGFHTREEIESGGAHEIVDAFEDMHLSLTRWRSQQEQQQQ
jgi:phosphoglycolate phosphatase